MLVRASRRNGAAVKVIVVADDQRLVKDTSFSLLVGYPECSIVSAKNGAEGIAMVEAELPDLAIISSNLADTNITGIIDQIRQFSDIPLLVLIEGENEIDRAMVLEAGADDYIINPVNPIELIARVRALLRRINGQNLRQDHTFSAGELVVNFSRREVSVSDKPVKLTPHEYSLLEKLIRNEGHVVTNRVLLGTVWGSDYITDSTFIKKYIYRLRSKIEADPSNPRMLLCERSIGYKFVKPTC